MNSFKSAAVYGIPLLLLCAALSTDPAQIFATPMANYECVLGPGGGIACRALGDVQCAIQGGGSCTFCASTGSAFAHSCVAAEGYACNPISQYINCGDSSVGNCVNGHCINLQPTGQTCGYVYGC
jgi:hypothetical protein